MVREFPDYWSRVHVGDMIQITSDNPNYTKYHNKVWEVSAVYVGVSQHPGYNMRLYPEALVECRGLPFAVYEYEFEVI